MILGSVARLPLVHPWDDEINSELQESDTLRKALKPGKHLGYAWVQAGAAVGVYLVGRYAMEPGTARGRTSGRTWVSI